MTTPGDCDSSKVRIFPRRTKRSGGIDESALLTLQESYVLSVLTYDVPALTLSNTQTDELNVCWNSVLCKILGYYKWESVKSAD
jgi:hypothetical protein